jgi:putative sigma-54 modulation protein
VRTVIKGKNIEVPDRVRRYAEQKLHSLDRVVDDTADAVLELSVEQHRSAETSHIAEVTLLIDGRSLRTHAAGATHQAAIDELTDRLERRAVDHLQRPLGERDQERRRVLQRLADGTTEGQPERRVVKTKRFGIQPMFEEDAVAQMEDLGHSFYIFVNAENERLNVLYRRADGNYGVIEPVLDGGGSGTRESRSHPNHS